MCIWCFFDTTVPSSSQYFSYVNVFLSLTRKVTAVADECSATVPCTPPNYHQYYLVDDTRYNISTVVTQQLHPRFDE